MVTLFWYLHADIGGIRESSALLMAIFVLIDNNSTLKQNIKTQLFQTQPFTLHGNFKLTLFPPADIVQLHQPTLCMFKIEAPQR